MRFEASGLNITRLPLNAGPSDPHVPILTSSNLATANRLIVYFGESMQDLGIFAHRIIGQDSIASGSALDFVHTIQSREDSANTAVIIANLGQLVWYRRGQRAMTIASWNALPRKTGVGNAMRIDAVKNRVPGNGSTKEHVKSVFEDVLGKLAKQDAVIDVIGLGEGAEEAVGYLDQNWEHWERKVKAICVGLGFVWRVGHEIQNKKILDFWGKVSFPISSIDSYYMLTFLFISVPVRTSSTMHQWRRLLPVARSSAVIASPRGNLPSPSASCQGPTKACLNFFSLSTISLDIWRQNWTYQRTRMTCRESSDGRLAFVLKAPALLRE